LQCEFGGIGDDEDEERGDGVDAAVSSAKVKAMWAGEVIFSIFLSISLSPVTVNSVL